MYLILLFFSFSHPNINLQTQPYDRLEILDAIANNTLKNSAIASIKAFASYYNLKHTQSGNFIVILKERVRILPFCIYMRKNSYLTKYFNDLIKLFIAHGIIDRLENIFLSKNSLNPKYITKVDNEPRPLTIEQVNGIFLICGYLYGVATIVFVMELFWKKIYRKMDKKVDTFTYVK